MNNESYDLSDYDAKLIDNKFENFIDTKILSSGINFSGEEYKRIFVKVTSDLHKAVSKKKRILYINKSFNVLLAANQSIQNDVSNLLRVWNKRNKEFGEYQANLLDDLLLKNVGIMHRPSKHAYIEMDFKFKLYCKSTICDSILNFYSKTP